MVADDIFFQDNPGGISADVRSRMGQNWSTSGPTALQLIDCSMYVGGINRSANTITLTRPSSWNNGDPVYLYKDSSGTVVLNGANPDLGAMVASGSGSGSPPAPPTGLAAPVN